MQRWAFKNVAFITEKNISRGIHATRRSNVANSTEVFSSLRAVDITTFFISFDMMNDKKRWYLFDPVKIEFSLTNLWSFWWNTREIEFHSQRKIFLGFYFFFVSSGLWQRLAKGFNFWVRWHFQCKKLLLVETREFTPKWLSESFNVMNGVNGEPPSNFWAFFRCWRISRRSWILIAWLIYEWDEEKLQHFSSSSFTSIEPQSLITLIRFSAAIDPKMLSKRPM